MIKQLKYLFFALVFLTVSACTTFPTFELADNPDEQNTYEIAVTANHTHYKHVSLSVWIDVKAALEAKNRECTHYRKVNEHRERDFNRWTKVSTNAFRYIYECVDVKNLAGVITSGDTITINDEKNIGSSSRTYKDIKPLLFQHRRLADQILKNGN